MGDIFPSKDDSNLTFRTEHMNLWQRLLTGWVHYKPRDFVPEKTKDGRRNVRWEDIRYGTGIQNLYYRPTELGVSALNKFIREGNDGRPFLLKGYKFPDKL